MTIEEVKDMLPQKPRPNRAVSLLRRETLCILIKGKRGSIFYQVKENEPKTYIAALKENREENQ